MQIFILGICGTFMGSLAVLAREAGHQVRGCDVAAYPPMSTMLAEQGVEVLEGYDPAYLDPRPDLVVIGNALSRGNPCVEYVLDQNLPYVSGPQWLADAVLRDRWTIACSGTHGKTSTASMVAAILDDAKLNPGFLIGGVPLNFSVSARLGDSPFFVVEADEYDTAFFDKRSKFVHYRPRTLIINNLEYDHADIFPDLAAIERQFHHLLRTVPQSGCVIMPAGVQALDDVLGQGCWTPVEKLHVGKAGLGVPWSAHLLSEDGSDFDVLHAGQPVAHVRWDLTGHHNVANGMAAMLAARHAGVPLEIAAEALGRFRGVKRRLEVLGNPGGVTVYDDFAHHPTAIATTLQGLRAHVGADAHILALIEPRSNTMRMGIHRDELMGACRDASEVIWYQSPGLAWNLENTARGGPVPARILGDTTEIVRQIAIAAQPGWHVVVMSNGGFEGIHGRLLQALEDAA